MTIYAEAYTIETVIESMQGTASIIITIMGLISITWATILLIKKLMARDHYDALWTNIITLYGIGGALSAGGFAMQTSAFNGADSKSESDGSEEPSSSPTPAPEPSSEAPSEPRDPITLPKIENTETIFIVLAIIIVAIIIAAIMYLLVKSISKNRKQTKQLAERQAALAEKWEAFTTRANRVRAKLYEAETDWDMLFSFPAITDVSVPATAKLHAAMRQLDVVSSEIPQSLKEDPDKAQDLTTYAYPKAVLALEGAWQAAFAHARLVGQSVLPAEERETVREIQQLLKTAMDSGASEHERDMFYRRAQKLIKTLRHVSVPDRAFSVLEGRTRLMITAGDSSNRAVDDETMDEITRQILSEDPTPETREARAWKKKVLS